MLVTNLDLDNMKQLQSNFTTTEQSKRLLELGLPADSADCFYQLNPLGNLLGDTPIIISFNLDVNEIVWDEVYAIPCWSGGRLIELYMKARGLDFMYFRIMSDDNMIDSIVRMFVENQNEIEFSKL
jgi:hypothetical protein